MKFVGYKTTYGHLVFSFIYLLLWFKILLINIFIKDAVEEVSEEVLAIASLDPAELASQASRLLEEHDLTNMLNQIPFSDLFTGIVTRFI